MTDADSDLGSVRAGDQTFVRRCRMASTGVIRLVAVVITWRAVQAVLAAVVEFNQAAPFGGRMRLEPVVIAILCASLASGVALWYAAGWISRQAFRMPAGRNQCPKCKYPIAGIDSNTCPECGTRVR